MRRMVWLSLVGAICNNERRLLLAHHSGGRRRNREVPPESSMYQRLGPILNLFTIPTINSSRHRSAISESRIDRGLAWLAQ
ncbi:hypothetical protein C8Q78DRAFT_39937 [Trametes maxima]|nr:hypothetical protein C8Q78DRAFT_39937 [Trametes maxima]